MFNEKNDFDQRAACGAPVHWLINTTHGLKYGKRNRESSIINITLASLGLQAGEVVQSGSSYQGLYHDNRPQ